MYASLFGISGALHLDVFEQPEHRFFSATCQTPTSVFGRRKRKEKTSRQAIMAEINQIKPLSTQEVKELAPSTGLGAVLRNEREKKGLTLDQVASITKLRVKIVEAIENETWGDLPPPVFVRGFIRSYAKVLGLDGTELLHLHERVAPLPTVTGKPVEVQHRSYKGRFLLAVILVLILGFVAYLLVEYLSPSGEQLIEKKQAVLESGKEKRDAVLTADKAQGGGEKEPSPAQGTAAFPAAIPAREAGIPPREAAIPAREAAIPAREAAIPAREAAIPAREVERSPADAASAQAQALAPASAMETQAETVSPETYELKGLVLDETWVRIQIDNGGLKEYIFQPGARPQWKAREGFHLTVGNAAGIELELNGTKLKSLGKPGKVVKLNLPASFRPARSED
jgi:cytoskeletal protein RodZ